MSETPSASNTQTPSEDTLPQWLYQRFGKYLHGGNYLPWDRAEQEDRDYWAHEAAAVRRAVSRVGFKPTHTGPGRPASELPEWAVDQLADRGIDPSDVTHFIPSSDGRKIAAAVKGKPVHLARP